MPPPITKQIPVGFLQAFKATKSVLNEDPRLVLHTLDKAGRFVAWEKAGGIVFFRHRTVLDIRLESVDAEETRISIFLSAEDYETGGFKLPADWYPSAEVDMLIGEDIMALIEKRIETAKE
jgi:hypothetical protein